MASSVGDTLSVLQLDTANATFVDDTVKAWFPVDFDNPAFWGTLPALGDLDGDGTDDIAFATENKLYELKMVSDTGGPLSSLVGDSAAPYIAFGIAADNRLRSDEPTPQALIADIDATAGNEVIVNHYGDGMVWAFDANENGVGGFPLRMRGEMEYPCVITDLESDGVLDLVATDNGGYLYAFALDSGAVHAQAWPSRFGDSWNTGYTGYRSRNTMGHVHEEWQGSATAPYRWIETGPSHSLGETSGNFVVDGGVMKAQSYNGRNCHIDGPGLGELADYTMEGTLKFDSTNVAFGINLCSGWPDSSWKYSLLRGGDGKLHLYRCADSVTSTPLASSSNSVAVDTDVWYRYRAIVAPEASLTKIRAHVWPDSQPDPTMDEQFGESDWHIKYSDTAATRLARGTVGLCAGGDEDGYKYWGPITVSSNVAPTYDTITVEDFLGDSVVDVKPYVPVNWHPDYQFARFELGEEINGFTLDTSTSDTNVLVYRHRPGVEYPVTCRLVPETNLEWRDYEFTGTAFKPNETAYDTVVFGIVFHYQCEDTAYKILFERTGIYLDGGKWNHQSLDATHFGAGDTLDWRVRVSTNAVAGVVDAQVLIDLDVRINEGAWNPLLYLEKDESTDRIVDGQAGLLVDMSTIASASAAQLSALRIEYANLAKTK